MPSVAERLGLRVAALRMALGRAQHELGLSASVISRLERGKTTPSVEMLGVIAGKLGVALADLFTFRTPRRKRERADRRSRALRTIGYILRDRDTADVEAVLEIVRSIFEIKRRGRYGPKGGKKRNKHRELNRRALGWTHKK